MAIKHYNSLSELAHHYDGFIIDLWGVIHDGLEMYPGVVECLEELRNHKKKVIFLSNAPRRAWVAQEKLDAFGIDQRLYHEIMTSGESVFKWMRKENPFPEGSYYTMIGPKKDDGLLDDLARYSRTHKEEMASFMIATGYDHDDSSEDEKDGQLKAGLAHNLPLVCANPDHVVVRINGKHVPCAGILADRYKAMGGKVYYFGKPHAAVYAHCFRTFSGIGIRDKKKILAIGDSLTTDIRGACDAGIDSILIAGGILGERLGIKHGELPNDAKLEAICKEEDIFPTGVMPEFIW